MHSINTMLQQAVGFHQQGHLEQAENLYKILLKTQPQQVDALHLLGVIANQRGQSHIAVDLISKAIDINPNNAAPYLNLGNAFQALRLYEEALASYDKALHIKPDYVAALFNRGNVLNALQRYAEALASYNAALNSKPDYAEAFFNRGMVLKTLKRYSEALASYDAALSINANYAEAFLHRGNVLNELERYDEAIISYNHALHIKPDYIEAFFNRGVAQSKLQRYEEAIDSYDCALTIKQDYADVLANRGMVLKKLKRYEEALASYDCVLAIKPDYVDTLTNRGNVLSYLMRYEEALASYNRALAINSDDIDALSNRGIVLNELKRYDEAIASYNHALTINPDYTEALYNRGNMLQNHKRYQEAITNYKRVLNINPDYEFLLGYLLYIKMKICDWSEFDNDLNALVQGVTQGKNLTSPFPTLATFTSAALQKAVACRYIQAKYPCDVSQPPLVKHAHKKIKIGYFSPDFRIHPLAYLMIELFERHDRSQFEIIAFSFHATRHKDVTRLRLEKIFDQFIDVSDLLDKQVVKLAREMECDIAVDLGGFTGGCRTNLFAMRVAPIQVNYLGYPGTMGADYMDYILADAVLIPTEYQAYYTEKVAYLPHSYQVSDSNRLIADREFTRADVGLPEQGFVFCCFNNNYKITPTVFDSWMRILHQVEDSILWLLEDNANAAKNLRLAAAARGINPNRLYFAQRLTLSEHLARHRVADLFLDTLPYNAHTTTNDALWAGLPVLTCVGETFASRVAASLLHAIGLPELVTTNRADYEILAIQLAKHPEQLAILKQKLANNRLSYPLFNTALFTQHIESAYQTMFERYQAGLAPEHIYIAKTGTKS